MQYCSLEFTYLDLPVAVHSRWTAAQTQGTLYLFADHRHLQALLPDLPPIEAMDLARCMMHCALPADIGEGMYRIEGAAALTLTNFLVLFSRETDEVLRIATVPNLMGFWEPPAWRVPDAGIILWFHPDDGYRAVIAYAKDQATDAIAKLPWLERKRRLSLLASISKWHTPRQSPHVMQEIRGICAEVLCRASLAAKVRHAILKEQARLRPRSAIVN